MKKYFFIAAMLLLCTTVHAQDSWTIDAGLCSPIINLNSNAHPNSIDHTDNFTSPTITARLQWRKKRPLIWGLGLAFVNNNFTTYISQNGTTHVKAENHINTVFIQPMLGLSMGRNRYAQFNIIPEIGIYAGGRERVHAESEKWGYSDNVKGQIAPVQFRLAFELQGQIPVNRNWRITISNSLHLCLSHTSDGDAGTTSPATYLRASDFTLRFGIRHIKHYDQ